MTMFESKIYPCHPCLPTPKINDGVCLPLLTSDQARSIQKT